MKVVCPKHCQAYESTDGCPYCVPAVSTPIMGSRFGGEVERSALEFCLMGYLSTNIYSGSNWWLYKTWDGDPVIKEVDSSPPPRLHRLTLKKSGENIYKAFFDAIEEKGERAFEKVPPPPNLLDKPIGMLGSVLLGAKSVRMGNSVYAHRFHFAAMKDFHYFLVALSAYAGHTP